MFRIADRDCAFQNDSRIRSCRINAFQHRINGIRIELTLLIIIISGDRYYHPIGILICFLIVCCRPDPDLSGLQPPADLRITERTDTGIDRIHPFFIYIKNPDIMKPRQHYSQRQSHISGTDNSYFQTYYTCIFCFVRCIRSFIPAEILYCRISVSEVHLCGSSEYRKG